MVIHHSPGRRGQQGTVRHDRDHRVVPPGAVHDLWRAEPPLTGSTRTGDARDLAAFGEDVRSLLWSLCRPDAGHATFVAQGSHDIAGALARLASGTQRSVRNIVVSDRFDGSGQTTALNAAAHRRGVIIQRVVNALSVERYSLLPLTNLYAQRVVVAPVRQTLILADDRLLVFAGPRTDTGESTMWFTRRDEAISAVRELTDAMFDHGPPVEILPPTPTNRRRLDVLIQILGGQTDTAIARRVGVSVRCVEKDVAAIKELAGVGTRMELVWALGYGLDRP